MDGRILLGPAEVDLQNRTIRVSGRETRVDHKAMQVLARLAESPDRIVTKDELFEAAWKGRFVGDDVLPVAVRTLRRALGDDARSPRFIETIPREGYRLIAPVGPVGESRPGQWARRAVATLAVAGLAALALYGVSLRPAAESPPTPPSERPTILLEPFALTASDPESADPELERMAATLDAQLLATLAREPTVRVFAPGADEPTPFRISGELSREAGGIQVRPRLTTREGEVLWAPVFAVTGGELEALPERIARAFQLGALPQIEAIAGSTAEVSSARQPASRPPAAG